jgi:predicted ATPase
VRVWSYGLLPERGQAVLRRLAAFTGGCTLEAAEQVAAGGAVVAADVAPALADLADRCLLMAQPAGSGTWRFGLLETVREYAADRLRAAGEEPVTLAAHLDWCRAVVAAREVRGADGAADLAALIAEWPNLTAALQRATGTARRPARCAGAGCRMDGARAVPAGAAAPSYPRIMLTAQ